MQWSVYKKVGKRILQVLIPAIILLLIIYTMRDDWSKLAAHQFQLQPGFLALSFVGFLLQELSYGLIWRAVLGRLGVRLDLRACLRIYLASEFVRYIPGNVWHVLTRILWVGKYGVSRPVAFASMTIELITKLAAGAIVFAVSLFFWQDVGGLGNLLHGTPLIGSLGTPFVVTLGVACLLALLVGLHPRILNSVMGRALRLLKREPVVLTLRYQDILLVTLAWCGSWFIAGCAFYALLLALWPQAPLAALPLCIGIYAFVWDFGFLSFITPSGLGVREVAVVVLFSLAFPLPAGIALILALVSRIVSTLAELLCVSVAYISGGRQMRAVTQAQQDQSLPAETGLEGLHAEEMASEASTRVGVEGGGR
ncbi:MAG TPA: lysylphosphatidylglycerol synthase transmembrane domain-containing protein [Ktedonosporobacter sp.]|nr:lysylphosphatidylglycerol synthase transmembrane domain-containing protein [Ktedonosporobacter sp.]